MKRSEIESLCTEGLITAEQRDRILARLSTDASRAGKRLMACFATLAALLIVGGVIMLVSANWAHIPDLVKMISGMLLLVAAWIGYACCRMRYPKIAEALALAGAGMWLADIALYAQIFQLQNPFVEGCFLFFCGVALLPFIIPGRLLMLAVAVTSVVLLAGMLETSPSESWLGLGNLAGHTTEMAAFSALAVAWWLFGECCRRATSFYRHYAWVGAVAFVSWLLYIQTMLMYVDWVSMSFELSSAVIWGIAALAAVLVLKAAASWKAWLPFWVLMAATLPLAFVLARHEDRWTGIAFCFVYALSMMFYGAKARRIFYVNAGSLLVVLAAVALISDVLGSYTASGFSLIGGGVLLLVLAFVIEKQRRRAVAAIRTVDKPAVAPESTPPKQCS